MRPDRTSPSIPILLFASLAASGVFSACDDGPAFGNASSIIVGADSTLWEQIADTVLSALEPPIVTVREERSFELTHQDPREPQWGNLKRFRQELLIGTEEDPWVAAALKKVRRDGPISPPMILQAHNVWARNQLVTILLLPPGGGPRGVIGLLPSLRELFDQQFRDYTARRMYVGGRNTELADSLATNFGFTLDLPKVYRWSDADSVVVFQNLNPSPAELIRQVTVAWKPADRALLAADSLLEWRTAISHEHFFEPQAISRENLRERKGDFEGNPGVEVRASWLNHPDVAYPSAGPLIVQGILCEGQNRVYLLDAWLYAPAKRKYEYIIQLETILKSFRCDP